MATERTEVVWPSRLPLRLRRVRRHHHECLYCGRVFVRAYRRVGRNAEGEWLMGDINGQPTGFMEQNYCARCRP